MNASAETALRRIVTVVAAHPRRSITQITSRSGIRMHLTWKVPNWGFRGP